MTLCSLRLFPLAALLLSGLGPLKADQVPAGPDPLQAIPEYGDGRLPTLASPRLDRPWDHPVHPLLEGLPALPPGHDTTLLAPRLRTGSLHFEKGLPPTLKVEQSVLEELSFDWLGPESKPEQTRQQLQKEGYRAFREDVKYPDKRQYPEGKDDPASREEKAPAGRKAQPKSAELYLQGHLMMKEGSAQENHRDFDGAYFRFKEARDLFDEAHEVDRAWQPEIVEYRRRKIREDMERVRQAGIQQRAGQGTATPKPPGVEGSPPDQPGPPDQQRAPGPPPDPDKKVRQHQQPEKGLPVPPGSKRHRKHQEAVQADRKDLRRRLHQAEADLEEARRREEALRTVVRDLIQQIDAPERRLPGFRQPPLQPPFPPPPPLSPPPPVPPSPAP